MKDKDNDKVQSEPRSGDSFERPVTDAEIATEDWMQASYQNAQAHYEVLNALRAMLDHLTSTEKSK